MTLLELYPEAILAYITFSNNHAILPGGDKSFLGTGKHRKVLTVKLDMQFIFIVGIIKYVTLGEHNCQFK